MLEDIKYHAVGQGLLSPDHLFMLEDAGIRLINSRDLKTLLDWIDEREPKDDSPVAELLRKYSK